MNKPWLIQRCKQREEDRPGTGFDAHFEMDYMGSAEFEFGALPSSLKQFTRVADKLQVFDANVVAHNGKKLYFVCLPEQWEQYKGFVNDLCENKLRLKERTLLKEHLKGIQDFSKEKFNEKSYAYCGIWWDIDNHVMFCLGQKTAELIIQAIKEVRANKERENKLEWLK